MMVTVRPRGQCQRSLRGELAVRLHAEQRPGVVSGDLQSDQQGHRQGHEFGAGSVRRVERSGRPVRHNVLSSADANQSPSTGGRGCSVTRRTAALQPSFNHKTQNPSFQSMAEARDSGGLSSLLGEGSKRMIVAVEPLKGPQQAKVSAAAASCRAAADTEPRSR